MRKHHVLVTALGLAAAAGPAAAQTPEALEQAVEKVLREHSEWSDQKSVVHLAGYAGVTYQNGDVRGHDGTKDVDAFSGTQFAPIFHYQYGDSILLESELELAVTEEGETDLEMEYLTIDWIANDHLTVVAGRFLSPLGFFRQNLHPSWINKLPTAPAGFGHDGAAPTSETGLQLRGGFGGGGVRFNYAVYVGNGPELEVVSETENVGAPDDFAVEGIMAEGFSRDLNEEKVVGGRLGILPFPELEIGLSAATGKADAEITDDDVGGGNPGEAVVSADYDVFAFDLAYRRGGLKVYAEWVRSELGDISLDGTELAGGEVETGDWEAWYVQGSYRVGNVEVVLRYGEVDTPHDDESDQTQTAVGVNYYLANNALVKLAYETNDFDAGDDPDRVLLQFAYGF
ncbi:porin [Inmirania thermothiophila]|uniref:Porin-like protein n=1 Tax=Inmirania thermothiophila TaxID=1750597 RepID=A0A3N1Y7G6_9GAMM|nr:porin [Inmirania thermothiophila]ROR34776.1 porin-like protein [Inmirania thermothiophila]